MKLILFMVVACTSLRAQPLTDLANAFLNTLSPSLKEAAQYTLSDDERLNFNFVPLARKGPTFNDFNSAQKEAGLALLKSSLSQTGYSKALAIMELEKVLIIIENQPATSHYRDPLNYHFLLFGQPSPTQLWGWKFEGHHISVNFVLEGNKLIASTPSFFGANPGIVRIKEQEGKQVLRLETELGFSLVNALSPDQLKLARFAERAVAEIMTGNKRDVELLEPKGIAYKDLSTDQQTLFLRLIQVYIDNYQVGFSEDLKQKMEQAGWSNFFFAWAGSLTAGAGHYYRIQGPQFIIEYANTQNNANHVHTVVRDLTNDFAEDILKAHFLKEKH